MTGLDELPRTFRCGCRIWLDDMGNLRFSACRPDCRIFLAAFDKARQRGIEIEMPESYDEH